MDSFVLKGNFIYSKTPAELAVYPGGYGVCVDGVCAGVFEELPACYAHLPVRDYGDSLIVPGLVDLHIHAPQYTFRGSGMDLELMDWLQQQPFPEEARFQDTAYARQAYRLFARQMRESATTRAVIFATRHGQATRILMEEMEKTGLYSFVGKVNMDQNAPENLVEESAEISLRDTLNWLEEAGDMERTKPILTPRFIPACSRELLEGLGQIRRERNLPVQSHLSENPGEIAAVHRLFPEEKTYGHCYERYGLMEGAIMAHCVYSEEAEVALLKEKGAFVAHCPASNTNLSSGIAPIRRYLRQGLQVGLGSDVAGGHSESIFRAMADAIGVSKLYWRLVDVESKPLSLPEAFYLGTRGGGAFFGKVGSFEEGYAFDALVLDEGAMPRWREMSLLQRLEQFVYLEQGRASLKAKYAGGRQIF